MQQYNLHIIGGPRYQYSETSTEQALNTAYKYVHARDYPVGKDVNVEIYHDGALLWTIKYVNYKPDGVWQVTLE